MTHKMMFMNEWQHQEFQKVYRRRVWELMMAGKASGWKAFFEMIEEGTSRQFLADHVRYAV